MAIRVQSMFGQVLTVAAIVSIPALGQAQTPATATARRPSQRAEHVTRQPLPAVPIGQWTLSAEDLEPSAWRSLTGARSARPRPPAGRASVKTGVKRALVGAAMGFGGFMAGGLIGARIEGNSCACDDPGLKGFVIGAPIGAVVGAVIGVAMVK
jgi:hypothetical protein